MSCWLFGDVFTYEVKSKTLHTVVIAMPDADICAKPIDRDKSSVLCWLVVAGHQLLQGISMLFIEFL